MVNPIYKGSIYYLSLEFIARDKRLAFMYSFLKEWAGAVLLRPRFPSSLKGKKKLGNLSAAIIINATTTNKTFTSFDSFQNDGIRIE